jgi:hypothetical protein
MQPDERPGLTGKAYVGIRFVIPEQDVVLGRQLFDEMVFKQECSDSEGVGVTSSLVILLTISAIRGLLRFFAK